MKVKKLCSASMVLADNSELFRLIVCVAIKVLKIQQKEIAEEFQVAESTVSRWIHGTAKPLPGFVKLMIEYIQKRAEERLNNGTKTNKKT